MKRYFNHSKRKYLAIVFNPLLNNAKWSDTNIPMGYLWMLLGGISHIAKSIHMGMLNVQSLSHRLRPIKHPKEPVPLYEHDDTKNTPFSVRVKHLGG